MNEFYSLNLIENHGGHSHVKCVLQFIISKLLLKMKQEEITANN